MHETMDKLVCVTDFEKAAEQVLGRNALGHIKHGADEEITLSENKKAFKRLLILPRMLRDVSVRNLKRQILGKTVNFPLGISPTGMQKLIHEDGEIGNARAAESMGTIFILSSASNTTIESVTEAAPDARKWLQLYIHRDRAISIDIIQRAEKCGFEALVFTVDAPLFGKRRANVRNQFSLPKHISLVNFKSKIEKENVNGKLEWSKFVDATVEDRLTWEDIDWLKKSTKLPIIVKGVLSREDAVIAVQRGVAGILVSNHGGRQLDTAPATLDVLEGIVAEVNGRCEVYLDGGISTGTDIFKALALGANMVFAGRALLWGLAVAGEQGSKKVLQILKDELDLTMALSGLADVNKIGRHNVCRRSNL